MCVLRCWVGQARLQVFHMPTFRSSSWFWLLAVNSSLNSHGFCLTVWVCLKMLAKPLNPMVFMIIIPFLNGYFIGNIPNIFRQTHLLLKNPGCLDFPSMARHRLVYHSMLNQNHQKSGSFFFPPCFFVWTTPIRREFHQECLKRVLLREERVNTSYDFFVRLRPEVLICRGGGNDERITMKLVGLMVGFIMLMIC